MQVIEQNCKFICQKHNEIITMVAIDEDLSPSDQLYCQICFELKKEEYQFITVDQAMEIIKEKSNQPDEKNLGIMKTKLDYLNHFSDTVIKLRSSIISAIDDMNRLVQVWITELKNSLNYSIDLIQGLEFLRSGQSEEQAYLEKIDSTFDRLMAKDGIDRCFEKFTELQVHLSQLQIEEEPEQKQQKIQPKVDSGHVTYKQVNSVEQEENCSAIAFNKAGTIMVTDFNGSIKVWQFSDGKMTELAELPGQSEQITCLVYSKKSEWFASGDIDGHIQLFKQGKSNKSWLQSNIQKKYSGITCLILNKAEDQLICGYNYKQILVWQLNQEKSQIAFLYAFASQPILEVHGLAFNESETSLVSCGQDGQIILWVKDQHDKWIFRSSVTLGDMVFRVCFITDNQLAIQQCGTGYTNILQIVDQQLTEQQDLKIQLRDEDEYDTNLFPAIFNKKNNILIQKSGSHVYIIKRINGQFKLQSYMINCETFKNYGSMTLDGQYLVIWNKQTKEFRIYKLI